MNQTANIRRTAPTVYNFGSSKHAENYEKRSVIAQPAFVFKKEPPYKRPAEDPVCKTENVSIGCSRKRARSSSFSFQSSDSQLHREMILSPKRVRSSSFTILPTFPLSQPVTRNNIFMSSTLLQENADEKATEKDIPSTNVHWDVLRPAILQPPQAPRSRLVEKTCVGDVLEVKHKVNIKASEDTYSLTDGPEKLPFSFHFSSPKTTGKQLPHSRTLSSSRHSDFVFGENIVERVLRREISPELCSEVLVFAKDATPVELAVASTSNKPAQRYLLEKVDVTTGEEGEYNVLQINCKLFLFNKISLSWIERGTGALRLNDTSSNPCGMLQSRLVMRNQGSMRLILNTRLWTQMIIERANRKSLCITATDLEDSSVKVFLIQASSKDVSSLYAAIHHRLVALRNSTTQGCEANQVESEPDILPVNCDSDEEENEEMTPVSKSEIDHSQWIRRQPVVCS
uniref:Ran-binding protein 3-like isoform X1 n=1 Tax=Pogona vitticeps TaxID=103695 RepID=A0A6J0TSS6_9SAUR